MAIKPIDQPKKTVSMQRLVFIGILILSGFLITKIPRKEPQNTQVLGEKIQTSIQKQKDEIISETKSNSKGIISYATSQLEGGMNIIVGEVSKTTGNIASKSAEAATDLVFQNTVGAIVKQIEKLPDRQREQIKQEVCR